MTTSPITRGASPSRMTMDAPWTQRISRITLWVSFLAIVLLAGLFTLHQFTDHDVFWHLKTGQWILDQGRVPRADPFAGLTAGQPWMNVAWGADAVAALLVGWVGMVGLQLLVAAVVMGVLIALAARTAVTLTVLAGALLFTLTSWQRLLIRPDILSLPLIMIALVLVERVPCRPRSSTILLAVLTALWVNLHGSFVLVPVLLLGAAGMIFTRSGRQEARLYLVAAGLTALAALVNPYGFRIYGLFQPYVRSILSGIGVIPAVERVGIVEWKPTWEAIVRDPVFPALPFLLLSLLVVFSFVRLGKGASPARILCGVALLLLGLTAVRHLLPFSAAALWIIASNEKDRLGTKPPGSETAAGLSFDGPLFLITGSVFLLMVTLSYHYAVITDRYYVSLDVPVVTGVGPHPDLVPEAGVQWLATHEVPGRLFNNYNSGSYLLYRLHPHVRHYQDPRFDVGPDLYQELWQTTRDPAGFDALLEREDIGTVFLLHPSPQSIYLLPRLARDPRWEMAFRDATTTIHVRAESLPPAWRETPLRLEPAHEPVSVRINSWLKPLKRASLPAAEFTDAFVSTILGERQRVIDAYRRALQRSPGNAKALRFLSGLPQAPGQGPPSAPPER